MFGISLSEIVLIGAVALIVIGPKQLPALASILGTLIYSLKNYISSLGREIYYTSGANELTNTKHEVLKTYATISNSIKAYGRIEDPTPKAPGYIQPDAMYQPELDFSAQPELFDEVVL